MTPTSDSVSRRRTATLATLGLLYTAQGIPFGIAAEYLPVVLREAHYQFAAIAAVGWLQLPWQLKVLWSRLGDWPPFRARSRGVLFALQLTLAALIIAYAPFGLPRAIVAWFVLTPLCALVAATQDIFVDALAVRSLGPSDRGFGNIAQVGGYRLGMLAGGAGLLIAVHRWGQAPTMVACGAIVALAGAGAFALRAPPDTADPTPPDDAVAPAPSAPTAEPPPTVRAVLQHTVRATTWPVVTLALTFKFGQHMASTLLKPMAVDAHWTKQEIGWAVVSVGTVSALLGSAVGGWLYRALRESRALAVAGVAQALSCLPLVAAALTGVPHGLTTAAIAAEHLASGLGTTVLFAALMTATRPRVAAVHYTVLTSANALAIGLGGLFGGVLADVAARGLGKHHGVAVVYAVAALVSLAPLALLPRWPAAARASAGEG